MAWIRDGSPPEVIKVSFVVSSKEHPELAQFIWSLQHGRVSRILRDILSSAVKTAGVSTASAQTVSKQPERMTAVSEARDTAGAWSAYAPAPAADKVSAAAADIIENFDKMFPSRSQNE